MTFGEIDNNMSIERTRQSVMLLVSVDLIGSFGLIMNLKLDSLVFSHVLLLY